jgi:hypothetical protein
MLKLIWILLAAIILSNITTLRGGIIMSRNIEERIYTITLIAATLSYAFVVNDISPISNNKKF